MLDRGDFSSVMCSEGLFLILGSVHLFHLAVPDLNPSMYCAQSLSCVQLFVTPWTVAHQAPLSLRFSRREYWSGLPCTPLGHLPNPGIKSRSPALQADSLPAELPGQPKNTGVSSLSLLQWIFPTQESNRGLLHCRRILYQLSYEGSPDVLGTWPSAIDPRG